MPLLYYWRPDNHRRDLNYGAGYHLNHRNPLLHEINVGDSLWAFTRNTDGLYVLAAELVVRARTFNPPNYRYGPHRVWGDLNLSRYFAVDSQPSVEQIIRHLSIRPTVPYLGQAFQGPASVRRINPLDHRLLVAAARDLALEHRARILPEERLEAALLLDDGAAVRDLIQDEKPGLFKERQQYLYQAAPARNRSFAEELQRLYAGRCQVCSWNPRDEYGRNLCHAHHIQWLSRGGEDEMDNLMLICPNHHAAVHGCDAPFDYRFGAFDFGLWKEMLQSNLHLPIWSA